MDERRQPRKKKTKLKTNLQKLKQDIVAFQTEVDTLLQDVPDTTPPDNLCVSCKKHGGCRDLPCRHILCLLCYQHHMKKKGIVVCPACHQSHYVGMVHSFDSFSSSSDEMA